MLNAQQDGQFCLVAPTEAYNSAPTLYWNRLDGAISVLARKVPYFSRSCGAMDYQALDDMYKVRSAIFHLINLGRNEAPRTNNQIR
jgi:hypothetical protein